MKEKARYKKAQIVTCDLLVLSAVKGGKNFNKEWVIWKNKGKFFKRQKLLLLSEKENEK